MSLVAEQAWAWNVQPVAWVDIPGGGQILVEGDLAFVGHMAPPYGTSIIDVADPAFPKILSTIEITEPSHSHKVRAVGNLMVANSERYRASKSPISLKDYRDGGIRIFDISDPEQPRQTGFFSVAGRGVHRFDLDARYAYISATMEGFHGNIVVIVDLLDPANPREVSRWWMPGQWIAGGERPSWGEAKVECHHPLRFGDRLYVSYCQGGVVILDVTDIAAPKLVGSYDYHPAFSAISHTFARMPFQLGGRDVAVVVDEQPGKPRPGQVPAFMWVFDVTDESAPRPISTYSMSSEDTPWRAGEMGDAARFGAHQCHERMTSSLAHVAWFRGGLRIVDLADPATPETVGFHIPPPRDGRVVAQSNDVFVDGRGYIYLLDRLRGLEILQYTGRPGITCAQ